jgi:hypothetical protein
MRFRISTWDSSGSSLVETIRNTTCLLDRYRHFLCSVALFLVVAAHAQSNLTVAWDRNSEPNVTGYNLYWGGASRVYTNVLSVGNFTTATLSNLSPGATYWFSVTACSSAAESDFSSEITHTVTNTSTVTTNVPPTLDALANLIVNEDSGTHSALLSGISSGGENQTVSVIVSATPQTLIPSMQVNYTSPQTTGSVSFVTGANVTGTGTITVTVSDGLTNTTRSFLVTVNPINDQPTLTTIANRTTVEDTATPLIAFTIGDVETPAANLSLSATSSDVSLIPTANIVFAGSGADRTVQVTPAPNQFGTVSIQISVSDGALSATRSFQLTVTASNDPPTIAPLAAATVASQTITALQPVLVADVDTDTSSLAVVATSSDTNVLPNANMLLGTTGLSRTLSVLPLRAGAATVTLTVSDGLAQSSQSFALTVTNAVTTNAPPTLAEIADLTVNEDSGPHVVSLTGITSGSAIESETLTVSISSAPEWLLPTPSVNYTTPASTGAISFVTGTNLSGTGTVTVTVSDGVTQTSRSFAVTVNPVNDPPTIEPLASATVPVKTKTPLSPVLIMDIDTDSTNLVVLGSSSNTGVLPSGNILIGTNGSSRSLTVHPLKVGSSTVTLTVSDGLAQRSQSFLLTVTNSQRFKIRPSSIPGAGENGFTLSWESTPGLSYRVMANPDLTLTNWINLSGNLVAAGDTTAWTDTAAPGRTACIYMIELVPSD